MTGHQRESGCDGCRHPAGMVSEADRRADTSWQIRGGNVHFTPPLVKSHFYTQLLHIDAVKEMFKQQQENLRTV